MKERVVGENETRGGRWGGGGVFTVSLSIEEWGVLWELGGREGGEGGLGGVDGGLT